MSLSFNLPRTAADFRRKLNEIRQNHRADFEWYPYDSLTNAAHLDRLLAGHQTSLFRNPAGSALLDVGCADGDFSFLLESLGFTVTAFDHPTTNHNGMRGIRALHAALGSKVRIVEADIDSQFQLPAERFRLAVFLGLLYHLKNPFHALERLSKSCDYCVLSTRIARRLPDGSAFSPAHPLAYLLAADELNADDSNYWIFNEAGLRRLLHRTNWEVLEYFSIGDTAKSDPVSLEHDERAFCLLRSHYGMAHVELLEGWYQPEDTGWRWVAPHFSFRAETGSVSMRVYLPPEVAAQVGAVRLSISADGVELEPEVLRESGLRTISRNVSAGAIVTLRSDKSLEAAGRELSLIVASVDFT